MVQRKPFARRMIVATTPTYGPDAPAVVLVPDAWTDGSAWGDVISRLQIRGLSVLAVQHPLSSLVECAEAVRRAVAAQKSSVVLVGHGWGGAVISQAGTAAAVHALVYVAAYAPDIGESVESLRRGDDALAFTDVFQLDAAGWLDCPQDAWPQYFAQDLPNINSRVLAATQRPIRMECLEEKLTDAAWHERPCWFLIAERDRVMPAALQRRMATRMSAKQYSVRSSHALFMSRPRETTSIILEAIDTVMRK